MGELFSVVELKYEGDGTVSLHNSLTRCDAVNAGYNQLKNDDLYGLLLQHTAPPLPAATLGMLWINNSMIIICIVNCSDMAILHDYFDFWYFSYTSQFSSL